MRLILALFAAGTFFTATGSRAELVDFLPAAPPGIPGDFNNNGIVSHSDYAMLSDNAGSFNLPQDFNTYRANYGDTASSSHSLSGLGFSITSAPVGGNVEWTFKFSNVDGALAGHLSIQVDGGVNAPNIVSATAGASFSQPVPGMKTFSWLPEVDQGGVTDYPEGAHKDSAAHQAYGALGTALGATFTDATLTFLTLVTEGQQTTTLRVLSGQYDGSHRYSEYGYRFNGGYEDFYFDEDDPDIVATFTAAVPEASAILFWSGLTAATAAGRLLRRRRPTHSPIA
jgi:hypothetical protein